MCCCRCGISAGRGCQNCFRKKFFKHESPEPLFTKRCQTRLNIFDRLHYTTFETGKRFLRSKLYPEDIFWARLVCMFTKKFKNAQRLVFSGDVGDKMTLSWSAGTASSMPMCCMRNPPWAVTYPWWIWPEKLNWQHFISKTRVVDRYHAFYACFLPFGPCTNASLCCTQTIGRRQDSLNYRSNLNSRGYQGERRLSSTTKNISWIKANAR